MGIITRDVKYMGAIWGNIILLDGYNYKKNVS